jgi:hypothetical protein
VTVSAVLAATFEALYSAYSRMQVQKTWESILNAPVELDDIVFAEMLWAALKALFSVGAILVVIFLLGISRAPSMLLALPVLGLVGVTFASLALVFNALAEGYDFFTYYFTLAITPVTFLSGVYFPMGQMPGWLQPGYYLYRERFKFAAAGASLGAPDLPRGKVKYDETFRKDVETHRDVLRIAVPVERADSAFSLVVTSQGCADAGLCYPPQQSAFDVSLKGFGGKSSVRKLAASDVPASAASEAVAPWVRR